MIRLISVLKFLSHFNHILFSNNQIVKILNNFENKFFILKFLSNSKANTFAKFISFQNIAEFFKYLL